MAVASSKQDHNKMDPQGPTKTDLPAPVFFPALLHHRRVSHSNHFHIPFIPIPFYPHFYHQVVHWSSFYQMARSSHTPERDRKVQPPRPPNAWILYRSHQFKRMQSNNERMSQAEVSKKISDMWRNETDEVKRHYEQQAEARKVEHQELYPGYRFNPQRKEPKRSRKKSKVHDAPAADVVGAVDKEENQDDNAPPPMPVFPMVSYMHPQPQSQLPPVTGYYHNLVMPQPFMIPYLPEAHYGPGGPSPPMSAAPSPAPHAGSESPLQPLSVASSSSSPSNRSSPSFEESQASSSSLLPARPTYLPSHPTSHQPSPNPYATLPLPALLIQNSMPSEQHLASPRLQLRSAENTITPAAPSWNEISTYLPIATSPNSEEVANLNVTITQQQSYAELQQAMSPSSSFDPLQALLSRTDENGVFNLSNIESSAFLSHPLGDLEVVMGPQATTIDYSEDLFADFDFDDFQPQMDSLTEDGSSSAVVASRSIPEDFRSLFYTPNNPELQAYTAAQQRHPSAFTQEMLDFLNFEAAEGSTEDAAPAMSPGPVPVPTATIAPEQVRLQSPQVPPAMPIFTQVTNTSAVTSNSSYVPPAGAIHSSTRRVGGSWKPSFAILDETVSSWNP